MARLIPLSLIFILITNSSVKGQSKDSGLEFDMSNPSMMAGSDLGNLMRRLHVNGNFGDMLKFTSKDSRSRFGDKAIVEYYQQMEFGYTLRLKSKFERDSVIWLTYETTILATVRIVRIPVVVENDTARIRLTNLEKGLIKQID